MTDTTTRIVAEAEEGLAVLDADVSRMRAEKRLLGIEIAKALADRKPLARIVSAAKGRKSHTNGDAE